MKRLSKVSSIVALCFVLLAQGVMAEGIPNNTWPASWFEGTKTAFEWGISEFDQSPILDEAVANGNLAKVEDRLPDDPMVVEPIEAGKYGGTAVTFTTQNVGLGDGGQLNSVEGLVRPDPQSSKVIPSYAKKYKISSDGKELTFYLRKGIKWSDGHPFTSNDFAFWWKYEENNKDLNPTRHVPKLADVKTPDDYTVIFVFKESSPLEINKFIQQRNLKNNYSWAQPAHHMKKYHKDFISKKKMQRELERLGFDQWTQYYTDYGKDPNRPEVGYPRLTAYYVAEVNPSMYVLKRNPYYPKVDTAGNQLPYIDEIQVYRVQDTEMMTAKAVTGEATFAGSQTLTTDIPLFKANEKRGGYKTYLYNRLYGTDVAIQFNLTHPKEDLRKIFQDFRFRKAMSLAINREEINDTIYYGQGTSRQTTVIPSSQYFEEEFAKAYTEYKPKEAKALLDEIGLVDQNGDGIREMSNGDPLNITLEWTPMETPKGPTMELVVDYWKDIGINVDLKQVNASLQHERTWANAMDATLWHGDTLTDVVFPTAVPYLVPISHTWFNTCIWRKWVEYYVKDGEKGWEPPQKIKDLQKTWEKAISTTDVEERIKFVKKILASNAENLWTIGTVGLAPTPLIVSNNLKNVPKKGYWGYDTQWSFGYHPETWYLDK